MPSELPRVWLSFLQEVDGGLGALGVGAPIELHCIGGFAVAIRYGLERSTVDLDVFEALPSSALRPLLALAGKGSALAHKHGLYLDAGSRVATVPECYVERLQDLATREFKHLRLRVLDPYDLALSKLERNIDRDREDVLLLARVAALDLGVLKDRYEREVRPFVSGPVSRADGTMDLWLAMIAETRAS